MYTIIQKNVYNYVHNFSKNIHNIVVGTCPAIKQFLSVLGSQALTDLSRRGGMSRARIAAESHIA